MVKEQNTLTRKAYIVILPRRPLYLVDLVIHIAVDQSRRWTQDKLMKNTPVRAPTWHLAMTPVSYPCLYLRFVYILRKYYKKSEDHNILHPFVDRIRAVCHALTVEPKSCTVRGSQHLKGHKLLSSFCFS